jgi:uncharacterized protein YjbI with pentapeptide repeats
MKIEITHRLTGSVLFSHDCENNSIKITLEIAIQSSADLQYANLQHANLQGTNLQDADLQDANLQHANLQHANLQYAYLQYADLQHADLQYANLQHADLQHANLQYANLQDANLQDAKLQYAKLQYADLDYSSFPLWCGSFGIKCDIRLPAQLAYHLCRLDCDAPEFIAARNALLPLAEKFHRYDECGKLEVQNVER